MWKQAKIGLLAIGFSTILGMTARYTAASPVIDAFTDDGSAKGAAAGTSGLSMASELNVTSSTGITVDALGYYDYQLDGLALSHTVTLYDISMGTTNPPVLATVTISAGTTATLDNGYRYVNLTTPVTVASGTKIGVVAYQMDGNSSTTAGDDPYRDNTTFNAGNGLTYAGNHFAFDNATSGYPTASNNATDTFGGASLQYVIATPEPSSLALAALAAIPLLRRRKRAR